MHRENSKGAELLNRKCLSTDRHLIWVLKLTVDGDSPKIAVILGSTPSAPANETKFMVFSFIVPAYEILVSRHKSFIWVR